MIQNCQECSATYFTEEANTRCCDTCSLKRSSSLRQTPVTFTDKVAELEKADRWTKETIKRDWKQAAIDSRATIIAHYNARTAK